MKKVLLIVYVLMNYVSYSQYCGNSGSAICNVSGTMTDPGLSPPYQQLPALINGNTSTTIIQFKNFNTVTALGNTYTVESLRFDSIANLPNSTCWSTNKSDNTYSTSEEGCIKISNIPCSAPGQYKLRIYVSIDLGFGSYIPYEAEAIGIKYFLRVVNPGGTAQPVDTSQIEPFVAYGPSASCGVTNLEVSLGTNTAVCPATSKTTTPVVSGGTSPYSYSWSAVGTTITCANCSTQTATVNNAITYRITVTDANNLTDTASVTYSLIPTAFVDIIQTPENICEGDTTVLTTNISGNYSWSTGQTTSSIQAFVQNVYSLTITDINGCQYEGSVPVVLAENPDDVVITGDVTIDPFSVYAYTVSNSTDVDYNWIVQGGVIQSGQSTNSVNIQWGENGPYSLSLVQLNSAGCSNITSVSVTPNNGTGIDDVKTVQESIYPNPSNGTLSLEILSNEYTLTGVYITDVAGKAINNAITANGKSKFTISVNQAGIYFVTVAYQGYNSTKRIVVTK